jgi:hypothetical protein
VLTSTDDIEMWGDGKQTRSFTFIDDCVEGILRITKSDFKEPLNLGSSEMARALRARPPPLTPACAKTPPGLCTGVQVLCSLSSCLKWMLLEGA